MERTFRTKVDAWLAALMLGGMVILLGAGWMVYLESGMLSAGIVFLLPVLIVIALAWPTNYSFEDEWLIVRSGFLRYRIRFDEIESFAPSRELWSSPAWSLDRVRINYGDGKWILVSPEPRQEFLDELQVRVKLANGRRQG